MNKSPQNWPSGNYKLKPGKLFPRCSFQINSFYSQTCSSSAKLNLYRNDGSQTVNTNEIKWMMAIYFCLKQIGLQLSQAEECAKRGITAMPSGWEGLSALWEVGRARSKWGTARNGRGHCMRRLQGDLHVSAWKGQCAGAVDTKGGELRCSQRDVVWPKPNHKVGTWWAAAHHSQGCLRRISREGEEWGLHSVLGGSFTAQSLWVSVEMHYSQPMYESRSEEGGMLVKINDYSGESVTVCLVKRTN